MSWFVIAIVLVVLLWDPLWRLLGVKQLFPWQLKGMLRRGEAVTLLDVRTPFEYGLGHVPGAANRPDALLRPEAPPGTGPVVVVCMTGQRSPLVARRLRGRGREVYNLTWGMAGWLLFRGPTQRG